MSDLPKLSRQERRQVCLPHVSRQSPSTHSSRSLPLSLTHIRRLSHALLLLCHPQAEQDAKKAAKKAGKPVTAAAAALNAKLMTANAGDWQVLPIDPSLFCSLDVSIASLRSSTENVYKLEQGPIVRGPGEWTTQSSDPAVLIEAWGVKEVRKMADRGEREAQWSLGGATSKQLRR